MQKCIDKMLFVCVFQLWIGIVNNLAIKLLAFKLLSFKLLFSIITDCYILIYNCESELFENREKSIKKTFPSAIFKEVLTFCPNIVLI